MSDLLGNVSGVSVSSAVGVAVARKALEMAKLEGAAAVSLIKAAGAVGEQRVTDPAAVQGEPGARFDAVV